MGQEITIGSERLVKVLDSVIDYDPEQSSLGSHLVDYLGNYRTLLFHYDDLYNLYQEHIRGICDESQRAEATRGVLDHGQNRMYLFWDEFARSQNAHDSWDKETGAEVAVLLRLIGPHYRSRMSPVVCKLQSSRPLVAFENLWLLYKPGSIVYKRRNDTLLGLVVVGATKFNREPAAEKAADRVTHYEVEAWYYEYNGNVLTRTSTISRIEQYEGDQSILSLPLIPAKIYDKVDGGIGRSRLRTRGERLLEITKAGFAHRMYAHSRSSYHGQIVLDPAVYNERLAEQKRYQDRCSRDYEWQWDVLPEEGLDPSMEQLEDPEPTDGRGYKRLNDYHELDPSKPEQYQLLMPDGVMLLYPRVGGLALTTKRWMRFEIEGISRDIPCAQPNQLQECLVAHEDDREVLRTALCKYPDQADFVPGKGEGQVFLLHGPPGTGKTLTAECVANDLRRPLISLTWNDFHGAGGEEQFLRRWFDLASKWGAILLIDEADVFLEKRSAGGYQNYTVTIFLRTMEYYAGVLFLTTNRPGQIDDSFISRITAAIKYPELTQDAQNSIWQKFFKMHEKSGKVKVKVTTKAKKEICQDTTPLNGREIRNIFQTAISLASLSLHDEEEHTRGSPTDRDTTRDHGLIWVDWDHFSKALERHKSFLDYLKSLNMDMDEHTRNKVRRNY